MGSSYEFPAEINCSWTWESSAAPELQNAVPWNLRAAFDNLDLAKRTIGTKVTFIAIDIEKSMSPLSRAVTPLVFPITEIGATLFDWDGSSCAAENSFDEMTYHYIDKEFKSRHNKFRPGYDHKNDFHGASVVMSLQKAGADLNSCFQEAARNAKVITLLHGGSGDKKDLAKLDCDVDRFDCIDTQLLD